MFSRSRKVTNYFTFYILHFTFICIFVPKWRKIKNN